MGTERKAASGVAGKKDTPVYSDYEEAKEKLLLAIEAGPFYGVLVGHSGTAKSSLLRDVASRLDRHRFQVLYVAQSGTSTAGLGRFLLEPLRLTPRRSHPETLRLLAQKIRDLPSRLLLFVDEAQFLDEATLQELRLIAESELDLTRLFSVIFAGLPELKTKLQGPSLFPLRRRISLWIELRGLKESEVGPFLRQRLPDTRLAELPSEALSLIFERARGIPAVVEEVARRLLTSAGKNPLTRECLEEVLDTCDL